MGCSFGDGACWAFDVKNKTKKPIAPNVLISRVVECQSICHLPTINTYTPTSAPTLLLAKLEMREGETTTRCNRPRQWSTTPIRWTDLLSSPRGSSVRQIYAFVAGEDFWSVRV